MHRCQGLVAIIFICAAFIEVYRCCEFEQTHQGCKIQWGVCTCGFGCRSEYRYSSRRECLNALKERSNICSNEPCLNRGSCIQVSPEPGFKCRCEGTGFYGQACENACPTPRETAQGVRYPYECVVI